MSVNIIQCLTKKKSHTSTYVLEITYKKQHMLLVLISHIYIYIYIYIYEKLIHIYIYI